MPKVQLLCRTGATTLLLCELEPTTDEQEQRLRSLLATNAKQLMRYELLHFLEMLTRDAGRMLLLMEQLPDLDDYTELRNYFSKLKKAKEAFEPFRLSTTEADLYLSQLRKELTK
jgi:hypothetical protein